MGIYQYDRSVILSQTPNIIRWLQSKADEAGSGTVQVSGLDCKVASDTVAGLLAMIDVPAPDKDGYWMRWPDGGLHYHAYHAYDPAMEDEE